MVKYKKNPTLSQGGPDIGLKVGILAEIGYMLHECAVDIFLSSANWFSFKLSSGLSFGFGQIVIAGKYTFWFAESLYIFHR